MRHTALMLLAALGWACGGSTTGPVLGRAVDVPIGSSVRVPGDTTTVRFVDVTADSRCADGAACVWVGDAAVLFAVGGTRSDTLHTAATAGPVSVVVASRLMTLLSLAPSPRIGQVIRKGDYVATIRFDAH